MYPITPESTAAARQAGSAAGRMRAGALVAVCVSILALSVPLLHGGIPAGHDAAAHLTYTYLFDRALEQGQFPVRWTEWVTAGQGQPLFNFYQPGLYYLVALIHLIVPSLSLSLTLAVVLFWWIGSIFVFMLARNLGVLPAALAAAVYAFSPYVILDVFVRSAYTELAALAFAPGVLWALDRLLRAPGPGRIAALALLAGLMLVCHPPSTLIFSPVFAAYAAYLVMTRQAAARMLWWLVPAGGLALGAAAFYIVPAIAELHLIDIGRLTRGTFDYRHHFVEPEQWLDVTWGYGASVESTDDGMSFQIGVLQSAGLVLGAGFLVAATIRRGRADVSGRAILCWVSTYAMALFLMTSWSAPIWRAFPQLAFVQYPWRFLMVTVVAAAMLAALLLSTIRRRGVQAAILLAALALQVQLTHGYLKPRDYLPPEWMDLDGPRWTYARDVHERAFIESGYFPQTLERRPQRDPGRWLLPRGHGVITPVKVKDDELILDAEINRPTYLVVNSYVFPGWRVWLDGREARVSTDGEFGYLRIELPPGGYRIRAAFTDTPARSLANAASVVSLAICCGLTAARPARRFRRRRDPLNRSGDSAEFRG